MIDNFDLIRSQINFRKEDYKFFHCMVVRRGKDHPDLPAANVTIKTWLVDSVQYFDRIKEDIIKLCHLYRGRAYINIAPKSIQKLNAHVLADIAQNIANGNVINPLKAVQTSAGSLKPEIKKWIVDIDSKSPSYIKDVIGTIDTIWSSMGKSENDWCYLHVPTNAGLHLITKPFNTQEFKKFFPEIDIHKNNPTVLYVPENI